MSVKQKAASETRAGDVLQKMREDIIRCNLKPGEKLKFEDLRTRYEVSFSTLREALSRLAAESLVTTEGQRGFVVAPVSVSDLIDLTNVRILLEKEALLLSIQNGDDKWEADIIGTLHRMERLQKRIGKEYYLSNEWKEIHDEFHFALISACKSPNLIEIRQKLYERAHRYRHMSSKYRTKWRKKDVEHKKIVDAVLNRDSVKSSELIEIHLRETTNNVLKFAGHLFDNE